MATAHQYVYICVATGHQHAYNAYPCASSCLWGLVDVVPLYCWEGLCVATAHQYGSPPPRIDENSPVSGKRAALYDFPENAQLCTSFLLLGMPWLWKALALKGFSSEAMVALWPLPLELCQAGWLAGWLAGCLAAWLAALLGRPLCGHCPSICRHMCGHWPSISRVIHIYIYIYIISVS